MSLLIPDLSSLSGNQHSLIFYTELALGNEETWAGFSMSQVGPLCTERGNNGGVKYLIYTPNPGAQLQVIKAGSWQRGESGNCNGC